MKTMKLMVATTAILACQASMAFDPAFAMAGKDVKHTDDMTFGTGDLAISTGGHIDPAGGLQDPMRGTKTAAGGGTSFSPDGAIMTSVGNGDDYGSSGGGSISTAINVAGASTKLDLDVTTPLTGHVASHIAAGSGHIAPA